MGSREGGGSRITGKKNVKKKGEEKVEEMRIDRGNQETAQGDEHLWVEPFHVHRWVPVLDMLLNGG